RGRPGKLLTPGGNPSGDTFYKAACPGVPGAVFRLLAGEDRVRLDLHPPPLVEQAGDDHHGGGRPHVAHRPGVSATHRSGHGRVGHIHPGTDHMVETGTQLTEGRADDLEAAVGLHLRVGITAAVGPDWSRARDVDQVAVAHRPAEPDLPLIWGAGGDTSAHPGTIPTLCGGPGRALPIAQVSPGCATRGYRVGGWPRPVPRCPACTGG